MSSYSGSTFDGLDGRDIVINATAQTNKFIATDTYDQYNTTGANMDFRTGGLSSTYTFKDTSGAANTSLVARNGLFTGAITAQYQTISPIASQTVPGVTITGPYLNNNANIPLLKVEKTQGGVNSEFSNISESYPVLKLLNTSTSPTYLQYSLAENLPSGSSISHLLGKNTSSNANAFLMQYYYDTLEANRKFTIRAWGDANSALEVYQSARTGTSATTGSVVVNGDLGSTGLRSKSLTLYGTSGSARIIPATTTTSYQLTLPSSIGAVNDYLQLGSVSGTNGTLQWVAGTGGGGGSSAYIATGAYTNSSFTFASTSQTYNVSFPTLAWNVNTGITYGTGGQSELFQNVSGGTLYIQVNATISFASNSTGHRYIQIITWNGSSTFSYNSTQVPASSTSGTDVSCSAIVSVANNNWFGIKGSQTGAANLTGSAKVNFSVLGGSGTQSVTLSALSTNQASTLFTTTAQQTGQNPTVSFDLAQSPTGSGKFVLATSPTISGLTTTGTLTSSAVSATSVSTSTLSTSGLSESALVVDMANTTLYPTAEIQLTSANSNNILKGTRSGFDVYLPIASSLSIGQIIKITNRSTSNVGIKAYGASTVLDILYDAQTIYLTLLDNTSIYSSLGSWKQDILLNRAVADFQNAGLILKSDVDLIFKTTAGESVRIDVDNTSSSWSFKLPVNEGLPGQVLTSSGSTSAMTWADAFTNQSIINSPYAGHALGNTTTAVSSVPTLKVRGISTADASEVLQVINASTSSCTTTANYAPNLLTGSFVATRLGHEETNYNSISQRFYLITRGSATENYYSINFYGQGRSTAVFPRLIEATDINTGTFQVYGGLTADSAYINGTTNVNNLNVRGSILGTVNTNTVQATTVNTTNLVINGATLTAASNTETDMTFWWAFNSSDPGTDGQDYPTYLPLEGGGDGVLLNRRYYWQQLGKQYTFTFNFYVKFNNTTTQLHLCFVRLGSHTIPTPACGEYTMNVLADDGYTESYGSTVAFGLGLQIPAS